MAVLTHLTDEDIYLFNEGTHIRIYEKLGAHIKEVDGQIGTAFAVWAPNAETVSIIGDFNGWNRTSHQLIPRASSGIWELFIPKLGDGTMYKFHIRSRHDNYQIDKSDPIGFWHETPPKTASIVKDLNFSWNDANWLLKRRHCIALDSPVSVYECHMGSWMRVPEEGNRPLGCRELAPLLAEHVKKLGFTHIEFMPICEHPFYGSWGYQVSGYFAPTSRYGTPQDFMYLIDYLHQNDIGVILDWVPAHFPTDEYALGFFDGTHLYEHADPRRGFHPDWKSYIFNYGRHEVQSFLLSSAAFWLDKYHVDGLRVDGVASMLYRDYSRREGEWVPNEWGGRENTEAVHFLRRLNEVIYHYYPDVHTIAEESTAWPAVSRPTSVGGLGFGYKWDMGWMHDTLKYFERDPIYRQYHQNQITFRMLYAFTENYMLPLSHDEVVHGKGSLLNKMPGDRWQKFANLRLLYGYMFAQPGKKLLFMGSEFASWNEWDHENSLDWHLEHPDEHGGMGRYIAALNNLYRNTPALYQNDVEPRGFEWVDAGDAASSVVFFMRYGNNNTPPVLIACNFTPAMRENYRVGVPVGGVWKELLNSDAKEFSGSGVGNLGQVTADKIPWHGRPHSVRLTLPPLGILFLTCRDDQPKTE
ncbi:MAG: 1,4-alpha-glucan branching protein GlgB [Deltaproteobacteria bacterium]|nr:1,4-alpha-glucan branching protein GlgB [Deltaproteobacteria bacterium]